MAYCSVRGSQQEPVSTLRESPYPYLTRSVTSRSNTIPLIPANKQSLIVNRRPLIVPHCWDQDTNKNVIAIKQRLKITNLNHYSVTHWGETKWCVVYNHQVMNPISCPYILNGDDPSGRDINQCIIYKSMTEYKDNDSNDYELTFENLQHMQNYVHYQNDEDKVMCRFGRDCHAFQRLERNGNRLDDKCHMAVYKHPARMSEVASAKNIKEFIHAEFDDGYPYGTYRDSRNPSGPSDYDHSGVILKHLVKEVVKNGFEEDLWVTDVKKCKINHITDYTLFRVVDEKMNCFRHTSINSPLERHEMLAVILYTGCECNWDLCASQRAGNYNKWHFFDLSLKNAIEKLCRCETGKYTVWSGLKNVKFAHQKNSNTNVELKLVTYLSASWDKKQAIDYMKVKDGQELHCALLLEISPHLRQVAPCCDVSWISRFPDEAEILFQKHIQVRFQVENDQNNWFQTAHLTEIEEYTESGWLGSERKQMSTERALSRDFNPYKPV
eukprot:210714_1